MFYVSQNSKKKHEKETMGAWGTAISSNDTYADIYGEFFELYNGGQDVQEISQKLIADNQEIINDSDDCNNFWFALAKAQWECKQLDNSLFSRVKEIIDNGSDLEVWRQLEADEKDIKKRKLLLDKFLADLQTERPKAKSRKKKIIRQPFFDKGDCLTYKLENGNYGGVVVLEAVMDTEYGHNLLVITRINQPDKPTKKDFENSEVLYINYEHWDNKPAIQWYLPLRHKQIAYLIEKVDTIDVQIDYDINKSMYGHVADFGIWIIEISDQQFKSEITEQRSTTKQTIRELTKNNN